MSGSGTNRPTHTHELHSAEHQLALGARRVSAGHPVSLQETLTLPEAPPLKQEARAPSESGASGA